MKVYVKYAAKYPYLPVAVADTKKELAEMVGTNVHVVLSSLYHGRSTYAEVDIGVVPETDWYPDNDGGLWCYDVNGETVYLRE